MWYIRLRAKKWEMITRLYSCKVYDALNFTSCLDTDLAY